MNSWQNEPAKINSAFTRIARPNLATRLAASRPIAQGTLRIWERSATDSTFMSNQAAGFSHFNKGTGHHGQTSESYPIVLATKTR